VFYGTVAGKFLVNRLNLESARDFVSLGQNDLLLDFLSFSISFRRNSSVRHVQNEAARWQLVSLSQYRINVPKKEQLRAPNIYCPIPYQRTGLYFPTEEWCVYLGVPPVFSRSREQSPQATSSPRGPIFFARGVPRENPMVCDRLVS